MVSSAALERGWSWKRAGVWNCLTASSIRLHRSTKNLTQWLGNTDNTGCCSVMRATQSSLIRSLALADEWPSVGIDLEGRIHHARGTAVATCHLAKLLRHHRHRCGDTD